MIGINQTYEAQKTRKPGLRTFLAAIAAVLLAITLTFGFGALQNDVPQAYATIYPAGESAQVDGQASDESAATEEEAAETEILDDEGTPLSSGLGGGEPISGGVGFVPVAIVGIAVVALFFLVLMRRLNSNIKDMSRMFK
ncbi:MAG: hypothetical protein IJI68_05880 [Eggerthellaceae bacterium]|nr:hypothetical protein [Eggerthellaceae bacterium]